MSFEDIVEKLRRAESGGRDFDVKGRPVTSPVGAKYAMQVMPSTAAAPGYGIAPATDDSPEEYNRVGVEYLKALMNQYGDLEVALAAYNAGPGNVDKALKQGREGFIDRLPKPQETKPYVQKILGWLGPSRAIASPMGEVEEDISEEEMRASFDSLDAGIASAEVDRTFDELDNINASWHADRDVNRAFEGLDTIFEAQREGKRLGEITQDIEKEEEGDGHGFLATIGKDLAMMGVSGATASAVIAPVTGVLAAAGVAVSAPVAAVAVPILATGLYFGMRGVDKLAGTGIETGSLTQMATEAITGEDVPEEMGQLYEIGEAFVFLSPAVGKAVYKVAKGSVNLVGRATGKVIRGVDLAFHKPVAWAGSKFEPIGAKLWDNVLVKTTHMPVPFTGKTLREVFQPGVDRLAQDLSPIAQRSAQLFNRGAAQKSLTTEAGRRLQGELKGLAPTAVYDVLKGLRGTPYGQLKSPEAVKVLNSFDDYMKDIDLNGLYERGFRTALSKALTKPIEAVEGNMAYTDVHNFLKLFEHGMPAKPRARDVHKILDEVMTHPSSSPEMAQFAKDLWSAPAQTPLAVARASRAASTVYLTHKLVNVPGLVLNKVVGSVTPGYVESNWRKFKGAFIPRDVELELQAIDKVPKYAEGNYHKFFLGPFKASVTIMRPSFHLAQTLGNFILNDWGGLPFWRMDVYHKALSEMKSGGALWKQYRNLTGATRGGSWAQSDLYQIEAGMKHGANMIDKAFNLYQAAVKPASALAVAETNMSRFAKYIHNLEKGMTPIESAMESQKWIFDFASTTPEVAWMAKYPVPFARWQSRILPLMAESAVKHPLRFFKWLAFYEALQMHGIEQAGMNEEEWERVNKKLPDYIQNGWFLMMPWRDDQGRLNLMNASNLMPGFAQLTDFYARSPVEWIVQNPFVTLTTTLASQKKFSGAPLYYEWEDTSTKFAKSMSYIWESLAPSMLPGAIDYNKLHDSFTEREDALSPEAAVASVMGLKMTAVDEKKAARRKEVVQKIHLAEMQSQMKKEIKNAGSSEEARRVVDRFRDIKIRYLKPDR